MTGRLLWQLGQNSDFAQQVLWPMARFINYSIVRNRSTHIFRWAPAVRWLSLPSGIPTKFSLHNAEQSLGRSRKSTAVAGQSGSVRMSKALFSADSADAPAELPDLPVKCADT